MSGNTKFIAGILLGAAAGVAATLFFQSEKGQELLSSIKDAVSEAGDGFDDLVNKGKQYAEDLAGKGKQAAEDVTA